MKRFFVIFLAAVFSMAVSAKGTGSGVDQDNAKEYDWSTGELEASGNNETWYHIDLAPVMQMDDPTLGLVFRNSSSEPCDVLLTAVLMGTTEPRPYTIPAGGKLVWSKNVSLLKGIPGAVEQGAYLSIQCSQELSGAAEVFETEDVDDACVNATTFNMTGQNNVAANVEKWFELDLTSVRSQSDKILVLKYTNNSASPVQVQRGLSPECPTTGVQERSMVVAPGATFRDTIVRAVLDVMPDFSYLGITADGAIRVEAEVVAKIISDLVNPVTLGNPQLIHVGDTKDINKTHVYMVPKKELLVNRHQPRLTFDNTEGSVTINATVDIFFSYENDNVPIDYIRHTLTIPVGEFAQMDFAMNMVQQLDTTDGESYVYARVEVNKKVKVTLSMPHIREKDDCKYAAEFDWSAKGNVQNAVSTKWYAVSLKEAKKNVKDVEVWIVNRGSEAADVNADMTFSCPYNDAQSVHRILQAGDTMRKVISYSTYAMMGDTVWVGLTADQPVWFGAKQYDVELKEPDEACLSAIDFDWVNGHLQAANDTVWYRVKLDTLRNTEWLPYMSITNRSASSLNINAELTIDCPDSIPNDTRSLSIHPAGVYVKAISRDMVNHFDANIECVYIRLIGNQDFSFQLVMEKPDQGLDCSTAVEFNWLSGNDQVADTAVWYAIDLTEVKATKGKDLSLSLYNRSAFAGTLQAELSPTCPVTTTQSQSVSLAANQMRTKVLPHSSLSTFGDVLYVRLSGNVAIHFEAELVDAAPFDEITACADAMEIKFGRDYSQTKDTVWYAFATEALLNTPLVPQVKLTNGSVDQTIIAEVSYECPVREAMVSRSITLKAGESQEKKMERSMCESVANQHDTVWVRLIGEKEFTFRIDMVDPNTGADCEHAQLIVVNQTLVQEAGTTAWYRVEMEQLRREHMLLTARIGNMDAQSGRATVTFYTECGGEQLRSASSVVGAGAVVEKTLQSALTSIVKGDWLYIKLFTERQDSIQFVIEEDTPIEPITACEGAREWVPNTKYTVDALTDTWFMMDLRSLRENYHEGGNIYIRNLNENDSATVDVWEAWQCPVNYDMSHRTYKIADDDYTSNSLSNALISGIAYDTVYVRFFSTQPIEIEAEFELGVGEVCIDAIPFNMGTTNAYYGGKSMWYSVHFDKEEIGDHEIYLHAENLSDKEDGATIMWFDNCETAKTKRIWKNTVAAGETVHNLLLRDTLQSWGWWPDTTVYINFFAKENMRLWIDTVPAHMTVESETRCGGDTLFWHLGDARFDHVDTLTVSGEYRDTLYNIYGGEQIFVMNLTVGETYLFPTEHTMCQGEVFEWQNIPFADSVPNTYMLTKRFTTYEFGCDSIYTLKLTINPKTPDQEIDSVICQGDSVLWAGIYRKVEDRYPDYQKNRFGCDSVVWLNLKVVGTKDTTIERNGCDEVYIPEIGKTFYEDTTYVDTVRSAEGCKSYYRYKITVHPTGYFPPTPAVICENELPYVWRGKKFWQGGMHMDSVTTEFGCKQYYTLRLTINPVSYDTIRKSICKGESYIFDGKELTATNTYRATFKNQFGCDSNVVLYLQVLNNAHDTTTEYICGDRYFDGKVWHYSDFEVTEFEDETSPCTGTITTLYKFHKKYEFVTDTFTMVGTPFVWRGKGYDTTGEYYDSLKTKDGICDSVYHLKLAVVSGKIEYNQIDSCENKLPVRFPNPKTGEMRLYYESTTVIDTLPVPAQDGGLRIRYTKINIHPLYQVQESPITIREGQKTSWYGYRLGDIKAKSTTEVTVIDTCWTFTSIYGCDSVHCTRLYILPRTYGEDTVDLCDDALPYPYNYTYGGRRNHKDLYTSGIYTFTLDNDLGGDSIVTLFLNVHPNINIDTTMYCPVGSPCHLIDLKNGIDVSFDTSAPITQSDVLRNTQTPYGCDYTYVVHLVVYDPAQGIDDFYDKDKHVVEKYIHNNQLYIIVDGRRYDAQGRRVK